VTVEVRLFAMLAGFYPPRRTSPDSALLDVPDGCTVADVASALGIPATLTWVALVNGHEARPDHRLAPRDVVTLFPPLSGGE
jgi:molybdopterin converting factor small subunit